MAEVMAQRASVEVLAGEIEAAGMAQRVRIDADGEFSADRLGEPLQHLAKIRRAPRRAALGHEHVHGVGILPAQLERSQRVLGRKSALCAPCRNRRGAVDPALERRARYPISLCDCWSSRCPLRSASRAQFSRARRTRARSH